VTDPSSARWSSADPAGSTAERGEERLRYRVFTGPDDASFCRRVSDALEDGYVLHGSPSITSRHGEVLVAQAVVLPADG